ncbi:hypothetical protein AOXY_G37037 [Acipenser oxyrinchus oxyrinchus]|uniref:Uncharacterized protein n=1 Tax=Acipenser oxyrinchus oxyrinchus TaxID=40147 RepID=A0AAD8FRK8_ACIOX|nr:hypothetical protein AOXY_G37037 [Acipenser oxyrinchus oxyrinchus]
MIAQQRQPLLLKMEAYASPLYMAISSSHSLTSELQPSSDWPALRPVPPDMTTKNIPLVSKKSKKVQKKARANHFKQGIEMMDMV